MFFQYWCSALLILHTDTPTHQTTTAKIMPPCQWGTLSSYLEKRIIYAWSYDIVWAVKTFTNTMKQTIYRKSLKIFLLAVYSCPIYKDKMHEIQCIMIGKPSTESEYCTDWSVRSLSYHKGGHLIAALQPLDICSQVKGALGSFLVNKQTLGLN